MYICERCGATGEELPTYEEDFGYETGVGFRSACQTMTDCCSCGGEFVEATECEECGEWFEENGEQCICSKCLEKYKTLDNAIKIGKECRYKVGINQFFTECFSVEQIEEILEREIREAVKVGKSFKKEVEDYLENDDDLCYFVKNIILK